MSELISRQVATDAIETTSFDDYGDYMMVRKLIEDLPSAELEIIQCKDCKYLLKWRSEESVKKFGQIYECGKSILMDPVPKDFCSKAKRRTDE